MATPAWLSYVGALTGMAGFLLSLLAFRRVARMKALDLRLELRKLRADCDDAARGLPQRIQRAHESRRAVAAAAGTLRGGHMEQWQQQVAADLKTADDLQRRVSAPVADYKRLSHAQLEDQLVEYHRLRAQIDQLVQRYAAAVAEDDKRRDEIRARH